MKKLILIPLAIIVFLALALTFAAIRPTSDSPEVARAKEAAAISDLQRQNSDAAFRSALVNITMLLVVLLVIALIVAGLLVFLRVVAHWLEVDRWRREKERDTFYADKLGNFPGVILNNTLHQLQPGNSPVQLPADNIIVGNSPMARIPATRYDVPMLINTGGQRLAVPSKPEFTVIQPEQLESPNGRTVEANSSSNSDELPDYSGICGLLVRAKAGGEGKNVSITAITGCKPGGSRAWKVYSEYWDNLV